MILFNTVISVKQCTCKEIQRKLNDYAKESNTWYHYYSNIFFCAKFMKYSGFHSIFGEYVLLLEILLVGKIGLLFDWLADFDINKKYQEGQFRWKTAFFPVFQAKS